MTPQKPDTMKDEKKFKYIMMEDGKVIDTQILTLKEIGEREDLDYSALKKNQKVVVVQSTGLKDKNGKEIYEGDIIEQIFYGDDVSKMLIEVKDVRFCMQDIHPGSSKENEIIGSKFENPEILK